MRVSSLIIRLIDIFAALFGLVAGAPLLLFLLIIVWYDLRDPLFRQERIGRYQKPFVLFKFRTMRPDVASVATHLADPSQVTVTGRLLRRTKLDELPQLWNVLRGDMSLVGPRPSLFNQAELISARAERGVFNWRPGITGLAQVQGIDMSTPELLAEHDAKMLDELTVFNYFRYIFLTLLGRGGGDRLPISNHK